MRKILICCTLGILVLAVAVQCWARQAVKHPDSVAGRTFQAVTHAVTMTNPALLMHSIVSKRTAECQPAVCAAAEECAVDIDIPEEVIRQHAEERIREMKLFPSSEIITVEASTCNVCPQCGCSASCEIIVVKDEERESVCLSRIGCPECCDSGVCEEEAPAYMPPAKEYADEEDPQEPLSFWLKIFTDILEQQAQSEPADSVHPEDIGTPEEDPNYHHQYPGCPYTGSKSKACCPSCCPSEEAKAVNDCKTNSHLWISLFPPAVWIVPAEQGGFGITAFPCLMGNGTVTACEPKAEEQNLGTRDLQPLRRKPIPEFSTRDKDRMPSEADVDTMEYRPSDAKKGEFDRIPY